jgi:chromosome partitioning protein
VSVPVIAFFNNKGGVGNTSLVYHLAWMFSDLGTTVVAADLDPQTSLTVACLDEDTIESIWKFRQTVYNYVEPIVDGFGDIDIRLPHEFFTDRFCLLPGDLLLSAFEDELSSQWQAALDGNERAFHVLSAFSRIVQQVATDCHAELILVDLGPNLGSINRAALIAADYVVVPLSPDPYSLRAMRNLGSTFAKWREEWKDRLSRKPKNGHRPARRSHGTVGLHRPSAQRQARPSERQMDQSDTGRLPQVTASMCFPSRPITM